MVLGSPDGDAGHKNALATDGGGGFQLRRLYTGLAKASGKKLISVHDGDPPFVGRNGAEVFASRIRPVSKVNHTSFPPKSSRPSFVRWACNLVRVG